MSDLVDRLRQKYPETPHHRDSLHSEAADRIEQLERVLAQAKEALWSLDGVGEVIRWDGQWEKCHNAIAAIDEALNHQASG